MDISEVAKASGVPASALRFYEEKGLIISTGRQGLRRLFDASVLEKLALIALGRAAGFSLDEMAFMFNAGGKPAIDRSMLTAKADEIDKRIKELKAMSNGLRHAAVCSAKNHFECPTFQRLLRAAATGKLSPNERKKPKKKIAAARRSN